MSRFDSVDLANTKAAYYAPATEFPANSKVIHVSGQPGSTKVKDVAKLTLFIVNYDPSRRKHTKHIQRFLASHRLAITFIPVTQLAVSTWLFEIDAVTARPEPATAPRSLSVPAVTDKVDVIIIGAGLAGLTAATDPHRKGLSYIVLKARDRVGGKTWSQLVPTNDGLVDLGAAWTNDVNQMKVFALAKRYGAEILEQNTTGKCVLENEHGKCSMFEYGVLPEFDPEARHDLARIRDMCEADCQSLGIFRPLNTDLDALTFEAYLLSRGASETSLRTATVWTPAMLGQDPSDISALFFLNYCKSGGGLLQMRSDRKGGGQHLRIRQGMRLLSQGLVGKLPDGVVRLSHAVKVVTQVNPQEINVIVENGRCTSRLSPRKIITTIPSQALKSISFIPPLPPSKQLFIDSTTYGYYTKAMMVFRTPFWVEEGYCGLTNSFTGSASVIRDTCSKPDGKNVLTCSMSGDPGRQWSSLSTTEREKALAAQIGKLFDSEEEARRDFVEMVTYEWVNDEYSGWGCPCTALTPGVLDIVGGNALRDACGGLHFAGTETAWEWKGYMEGAVLSGERASLEVAKSLERPTASL